jgi:peptidoglycan/LPS O-acetylase OafA/YrhL
VRVEIQALRALAVSLVVLYHVVPLRLPGGYVGVDVFFVVSGSLITAHLLREVERTGRIRLAPFWARRARRLLPASLLVLLVSVAATVVWVPQTYWQGWLREIGASALYVENWVLAGDAVDYLAHTNAASPAQHYWSLSTEEQFYLAWPLLVALASWVAVRLGVRRRTALGALFGLLTLVSFLWSLWTTQVSPPDAYFTTPTRAWEFSLGGLLALWTATPPAGREQLRSLVSWTGFGAIAITALTYTGETPFPGTAALLPVLGTVAVIWAGAPRHDWSPTAVADFGPVRFLGNVSYSAYLWHWPLVVVLPFALGHPLGRRRRSASWWPPSPPGGPPRCAWKTRCAPGPRWPGAAAGRPSPPPPSPRPSSSAAPPAGGSTCRCRLTRPAWPRRRLRPVGTSVSAPGPRCPAPTAPTRGRTRATRLTRSSPSSTSPVACPACRCSATRTW